MKKLSIQLSLLTVICVCACTKSYKNQGTPNGSYTLQSAFASLAVLPKTVTINAGTGGTFAGNSGTRYIVPAGAFKKSDGTVVTGNVDVTVSEFVKKSDMLFSGVLPITATDALISGGEVNLTAKQGGQDLQMAPGKKYQANIPQKNPTPGLSLFTGTKDPVTNTVIWKPANDTSGQIIYNGDTVSILSTNVNFANADRFFTNPQYQSFTISLSADGIAMNDSVAAFALFDNYNGVWPMMAIINHVVNESHLPSTPVHFAVISIIKGNFYGGLLGVTPTTGSNYTMVLKKTTPSAFKAQIDALP